MLHFFSFSSSSGISRRSAPMMAYLVESNMCPSVNVRRDYNFNRNWSRRDYNFNGCDFFKTKVNVLFFSIIKMHARASLMAQWLRICLPMQGTQVRALVREDPTCHRATKPVRHNYWACTLEPASHNYWARVPQLLKPTRLQPVLRNKRSHRDRKSTRLNSSH